MVFKRASNYLKLPFERKMIKNIEFNIYKKEKTTTIGDLKKDYKIIPH
jgi:hypothetical protein